MVFTPIPPRSVTTPRRRRRLGQKPSNFSGSICRAKWSRAQGGFSAKRCCRNRFPLVESRRTSDFHLPVVNLSRRQRPISALSVWSTHRNTLKIVKARDECWFLSDVKRVRCRQRVGSFAKIDRRPSRTPGRVYSTNATLSTYLYILECRQPRTRISCSPKRCSARRPR